MPQFVFVLAGCAQAIAGNSKINDLGLEYVIFALGLGLLLNHTRRPKAC